MPTTETQGVAAKPQKKASDESYRDGGDIQTRDSGDDTVIGEENDEAYRDGGDIQTREADTATSAKEDDAQTKQDDVERGT